MVNSLRMQATMATFWSLPAAIRRLWKTLITGLKRIADSVGERAQLSVRDYGRGIAPEHLPRLTERFYRVDVADSRDKGGTGLGLAIVKHIVNRHRGRLAIESRPGEGATFRVMIPLGNRSRQ